MLVAGLAVDLTELFTRQAAQFIGLILEDWK
jgi:hypothetical protein